MNNQGNKAAQKENKKSPGNKLKDMEICNLNDRKFKIAVVKKPVARKLDREFNEFRNKINEQNKYFAKEIENFKKNQIEILELKNSIKEMKNEIVHLGNRADQMQERSSDVKDRNMEMMPMKEERDLRVKRNERTLQELSDSIRKSNIRIMVLPEGEEREKDIESLFKEIVNKNFPKLWKELGT